ncbi:MAG TPA: hypothetical protein VKT49_14890, partial [Bryobacteraceae bacterium]|nr:hypothetical protein [Bryobacteraceae bacterium]
MYRVSQPYAPGATPVWTTYTYDGIGRTLTVTAPDGSVTRYSYQGNQTTVTDPAGKWKTTVTDAQGNLTQVIEPNPGGGANFVTSYTYDGMNHLTGVTMTRPEGTQTRSFVYTGPDLTSATNPENGTTTYTYNGAHQVLMRTDANRNQTNYTYDGYGRLTQVQHFGNGHNGDGWTYTYDTPIDSGFGATNTWGRLAAVQFGGSAPGFTYEYGYSTAGRITKQRMVATGLPPGQFAPSNQTLDATYTWDNEGRVVSEGYPAWGSVYTYSFDVMGRPNSLSVVNGYISDGTVATAAYGPAGEMTSLSHDGYNETRTYNSLLQLTRQTVPGVFDMEYVFPGGANNGQISSSIDHISGQQVN